MGYMAYKRALDILNIKDQPQSDTAKVIKKDITFDSGEFYEKMEVIRKKTEGRLRLEYPNSKIEVTIPSKERDLATQKEYEKSGASATTISLHNFGAAADFKIVIDGENQDVKGPNWKEELLPFRILGSEARNLGMFWGWGGDAGHVADTRFVHQFLRKYPEQIDQDFLKDWYTFQSDTTQAGYKNVLSVLDSAYKQEHDRVWLGDDVTIDPLLEDWPAGSNKKVFGYIK